MRAGRWQSTVGSDLAGRTLLTPHLGYVTAATYATFFAGVVDEDLLAHLDGAPLRVL
ncbi:MAG: hypothetical protein ABI336_07315 [Humibacillus sp.]